MVKLSLVIIFPFQGESKYIQICMYISSLPNGLNMIMQRWIKFGHKHSLLRMICWSKNRLKNKRDGILRAT